jgi:pimeloyl-ACP methyl ester carboxylesterase
VPVPHHRSGTGSPLVLLHGLSGTWRIWQPVLRPLSDHHAVFAPTLPGHRGGPELPAAVPVSVAAVVDGVEAMLDAAGIGTAHLVGNSLGGWVALELAARGRSCSVVALSPAGAWATPSDLRRVVRLIRSGARAGRLAAPHLGWALRIPRLRRAFLRLTMERGDRVSPAALMEILDDLVGCAALEDLLAATLHDGPFAADLSHLPCPIRVAWAEHDRTLPFVRYGRPLLDQIPCAELVCLPGVGHVPMFDDPALVTETILEVTTSRDAAGPAPTQRSSTA